MAATFDITIDPSLQDESSVSLSLWAASNSSLVPHPYLQPNMMLFDTSNHHDVYDITPYDRNPRLARTLPSESTSRQDSPFSQHHSPSYSSAPSPSIDSGVFCEGAPLPGSPSGSSTASPFARKMSHHPEAMSRPQPHGQPLLTLPVDTLYFSHMNREGPNAQAQADVFGDMSGLANFSPEQASGWESFTTSVPEENIDPSFSSYHESFQGVQFVTGGVDSTYAPFCSTMKGLGDLNASSDFANRLGHGVPSGEEADEAEYDRFQSKRRKSSAKHGQHRFATDVKAYKAGAASSKRQSSTADSGETKLCSKCKEHVPSSSHGKSAHGPLVCIFHYAGCPSRFCTKNEWKRHVLTQHIGLHYWICTRDNCARNAGSATKKRPRTLPAFGNIFNRKDLYTQHVRRMHAPPEVRVALEFKKATPDFDCQLEVMQQEARRVRCELPTYMCCPAQGCSVEFTDGDVWNKRMEHVALHLTKATAGQEPQLFFGGQHDATLTEWADQMGVTRQIPGGWELCNPFKDHVETPRSVVYEQDAEGEDC